VWPPSDSGAQLITSRCPQCGDVSFPGVPHCRMPACSLTPTQPDTLDGIGTVLSWTVHRYPPPGPFGRTVPYMPLSIALVEFGDAGIAVLGQVFDCAEGDLRTGRRARLVLRSLYADDDGGDVVGWGYVLQGAAS
jgi:uncharacterized OB-fold protein